ncbi:GPW/gp25 family protein [Clostridium chromiireducens]|uniref:Protein 25-like lysozyme n=1 Tax=Clostridium chromiireducens TaxID=225345 RepID=A0A1V4IUF8_9CLOT|nr:GPW/gp25 family protein [Clostridium chromiireducens]OPJ63678.1 protein 25-like lysozyme [Clostridium chromiireducens]
MININNVSIIGTTAEIAETLKNIFSTPQGTVPFDRNFGIDIGILDESINLAQGKLTVEFARKVQQYEPRVKVKEVTFITDDDNNLIPKVRVE